MGAWLDILHLEDALADDLEVGVLAGSPLSKGLQDLPEALIEQIIARVRNDPHVNPDWGVYG